MTCFASDWMNWSTRDIPWHNLRGISTGQCSSGSGPACSLPAVGVLQLHPAWWPDSCTCNTPLPYRMKMSYGAGLRIPTGSCSVAKSGSSTTHPLTRAHLPAGDRESVKKAWSGYWPRPPKRQSLNKVIVDSTVQEKAIAYPTDSKLLNRGREQLVKLVAEAGMTLRQNYNRVAPKLAGEIARYAHARQYQRMRSHLKKLKTLVGRVWRDASRQLSQAPEHLKPRIADLLHKVERLLKQQPKDSHKLYSLHAPEAECIAKGKVRQPYEFGVKVSVATTHKEGLVVGMCSLPGNPYDGHTLHAALQQVEILTQRQPKEVFVDLGYRGATLPAGVKLYHRKLKRGISARLKRDIRRRSAIEPAIGHMKNDGRLRRNWLKGTEGDAFHALLCGCGHNLRMILRKLRLLLALILVRLQWQAATDNAATHRLTVVYS